MTQFLLEQVTAPTQAVTLAEAKMAARVRHDDEDSLFTLLIGAAIDVIDGPFGYLGQAISAQRWKVSYGRGAINGTAALELPFGPVTSIVSIRTFDGTTLAADVKANFDFYADRFNARLRPKAGFSWPTLADREDALQISFDCGDAVVRRSTKQAILMLVAHWYANRETVLVGTVSKEIEMGAFALLQNERRFR